MKALVISLALISCWSIPGAGGEAGGANEVYRQEVPWASLSSTDPGTGSAKFRAWLQKAVFPSFEFEGNIADAIAKLMAESRRHTDDGLAVGGFVLRDGAEEGEIRVNLKNVTALELVDEICRQAGAVWAVGYCMMIAPRPEDGPSEGKWKR